MVLVNRRSLLIGLAAPAIVHYGNLMPVSNFYRTLEDYYHLRSNWREPDWYPPFYPNWDIDLIWNLTPPGIPFVRNWHKEGLLEPQRRFLRSLNRV
jgi:hypothetical protein